MDATESKKVQLSSFRTESFHMHISLMSDIAVYTCVQHLYAFRIVPMRAMDQTELCRQPEHVTESPYLELLDQLAAAPSSNPELVRTFFRPHTLIL